MPALETLIEAAQLHAHLHDPQWVLFDCRFELSRPGAGREAYLQGHIPGAQYAHLEEHLSGPVTATTGRHPLPDPARLAARLRDWGVTDSTQVVAYDEANGAFAARLWWLLRWLGHRQVAVLNGGLKAWKAAGYPTDRAIPAATSPGSVPLPPGVGRKEVPRKEDWLTSDEVQAGLASGAIVLIDARGADRFAGHNETIDPVAGHIPGARNHPFPANVDAGQRFLPAGQLRALWEPTLAGAAADQVVCMCGSGVTACHNLLALEIAGLQGAKLYAGSWSEWITDPSRLTTS
jgi:thiosulfate/3-mercaptopyruvate sulfurtransferase